jgi:hypothetical protein
MRVVLTLLCLLALATSASAESRRDDTMLMTEYKWASLTDAQRALYIRGFLETVSFVLYNHSRRENQADAQVFSDWTACAEREALSRWQTYGWEIKGELDRTAAYQFYEGAPIVCKAIAGTGDKTLRPVRFISVQAWKTLSLRDKAIYIMAYVETVAESIRREKDQARERQLSICIGSQGIEGLLSAMEQTSIEAQYPLPWSVSRILGKACRQEQEPRPDRIAPRGPKGK